MKHYSLTRLRTGIAVAAAVATVAAPTALAGLNTNVPDDPWFNNYVASHAADNSFVTDTLAPGGGSSQTVGYRFTTDTLAPGGGTVIAASPTSGFDWNDAGIGASSMLGLALIVLAGTRLLLQRRRRIAI
jgi:hypothetical protein